MKHILIITLDFPPTIGGVASYIEALASAIPHGERVTVYAPYHKDSDSFDTTQSYTIVRNNLLYSSWIWPRWLKLVLDLRKMLKTQKIDIIYVHHVLPVGIVAYIIKRLFHIPYIIFSHGTDIVVAASHTRKRRIVTIVSEHAEAIICNSMYQKKKYTEIVPSVGDRCMILYPCPHPNIAIAPSKEQIQEIKQQYSLFGKKVVVSIARFEEGKGIRESIHLLPQLVQHIPDLVWVFIGDGSQRSQIVQELQEKHMSSVVRYLGPIPHAEIGIWYAIADVFVLLTYPVHGKEEGCGLAFLEAAACGKPSIAGKSGGVEEVVLHHETGIVIDMLHTSREEIVQQITQFLRDTAKQKEYGEKAKQRIHEQYTWQKQLQVLQPWIE